MSSGVPVADSPRRSTLIRSLPSLAPAPRERYLSPMADAFRSPMPDHVRAALARAKPVPPGPERDRMLAEADEVLRTTTHWLTTDEIMATIESMRPRAAE